MSDYWDYRSWERNEARLDWQDIRSDNLEFRADALLNRAEHSGFDRDDQLDQTINFLASAADLNRELKRLPQLLKCLLLLGDCYLKLQRSQEVAEVSVEAQNVALQCLDDKSRAYAVHMQGYNAYVNREFVTAAQLSLNAAKIYELAGELSDANDMYLAATRTFRWAHDSQSALAAAENALRVAKLNNSLEEIIDAKTWIAILLLRGQHQISFEEGQQRINEMLEQSKLAKTSGATSRRIDMAKAWLNVERQPEEAIRYSNFLADFARENKNTNDAAEAMFALATAYGYSGELQKHHDTLKAILSVIAEIPSTVSALEVAEPLSRLHFDYEEFEQAEQVWVRAREILVQQKTEAANVAYCDQMIALCIASYASPERGLGALESSLPKVIEKPLDYKFEYALAKSYAANERNTEALLVIDRALIDIDDSSSLQFAELHELKCELLAKQGNADGAKTEAQLSFNAFLEAQDYERARRLKMQYLSAKNGDAHPATGAITLGEWN